MCCSTHFRKQQIRQKDRQRMKPYTYLIGWPDQDKWYYGVRYAKGCDPTDLWNPYTTSSNHVKQFVQQHGVPSVRTIRRTFNSITEARVWEERVLKRMHVVEDSKWLNKHDSMSPPINPLGNIAMRKPENRAKAKLNNSGPGNPMFGKKQKQITCPHCKITVGTNTYARWHGDNCPTINPTAFRPVGKNNPFFGKQHTNVEQKICSYCNLKLDFRNYARYHGNKCKSNLTNLVGNTDKAVYNNLVGSI